MNERIARDKTCPFIQNAALVGIALPKLTERDLEAMKDNHSPANINCIASNCMAWTNKYPLNTKSDEGYCKLMEG